MPHPLSTSLRIKRLHPDVEVNSEDPTQVQAFLPEGPVRLSPGEQLLLSTGLQYTVDPGYTTAILAEGYKADSGFLLVSSSTEGEAVVLVWNHTTAPTMIAHGDVLGRLRAHGVARVTLSEVT